MLAIIAAVFNSLKVRYQDTEKKNLYNTFLSVKDSRSANLKVVTPCSVVGAYRSVKETRWLYFKFRIVIFHHSILIYLINLRDVTLQKSETLIRPFEPTGYYIYRQLM